MQQAELNLAQTLAAVFGWQVCCPKSVRADLLLQRSDGGAEIGKFPLHGFQGQYLVVDEATRPIQLCGVVRVGAELPHSLGPSGRFGASQHEGGELARAAGGVPSARRRGG
ncbi:hypothetical protein ABIA30_004008 [Mycobacterium sp. MAA66]